MAPSRRRIITYALHDAASRAAFEASLDDGAFELGDEVVAAPGRGGPARGQQQLQQRNQQRAQGFRLNEGGSGGGTASSIARAEELQQLTEMFHAAGMEQAVVSGVQQQHAAQSNTGCHAPVRQLALTPHRAAQIADTYASCGHAFEPAMLVGGLQRACAHMRGAAARRVHGPLRVHNVPPRSPPSAPSISPSQALMDMVAGMEAAQAQQQHQQQQQGAASAAGGGAQAGGAGPSCQQTAGQGSTGGMSYSQAAGTSAGAAGSSGGGSGGAKGSAGVGQGADALPGGGGGAAAGAAAAAQQQPENLWELLHESLKEAVLAHLTGRDLAQVAWTCKDFAWRVRSTRNSTRALTIPAGELCAGACTWPVPHVCTRVSCALAPAHALVHGPPPCHTSAPHDGHTRCPRARAQASA